MDAHALNSLVVKASDAFEDVLRAVMDNLEVLGGGTLTNMAETPSPLSKLALATLAVERQLINGKFLRYITSLFGGMGDTVVVGIDPLDDLVFSTLLPELQERTLQAQLSGFSSKVYLEAVASVSSLNSRSVKDLAAYCDRGEKSRERAANVFTSWGGDQVFPGRPVHIPPSLRLIGYQYSSSDDNNAPPCLLCRGEAGKLYFLEIKSNVPCREVADEGPFHASSQYNLDLQVTIERPGDPFLGRVGNLFLSWVAAREKHNEAISGMSDNTSSGGEIINVFREDGFALLLRGINSLEKALLAESARSSGSLEWPSREAIRNVTLGREQSIFAKQEGLLNLEHSQDKLVREATALFSGEGSIFSGGALCSTSTATAIEAAPDIRKFLWSAFPEPKKKLKDDEFNPALAFLADRMDLNLPESAGWLASRASQYSQVSFKGGSGLLIPTSGKWLLFADDKGGFPVPRLLPFKCIKVSRQVALLPKVAHALKISLENDAMACILGAVRLDGRKVLTLLTEAFPEALRVMAPATKDEPVSFNEIVSRSRRYGSDGDLVACMAATAIGVSSPAYVGGGRFRCYFDTVSSLGNWPDTRYRLIADCPVPCPELDVYLTTEYSAGGSLYVRLAPRFKRGDNNLCIEVERGTIEEEDWVVYDDESPIRLRRSDPSPQGVAHMRLNRLDHTEDNGYTTVSLRVGLKNSMTGW